MKLQGLIFDIDGTLIDSNDLHTQCWIEAFEHFGKRLAYDDIRQHIGKGADLLVPDLLHAKEMRAFGEKVRKYRADLYKRKYMPKVKPFPRVRPLFDQLRRRKIKIALASSSNPDEVKYYTQLLGVGDLLEATTSKHDAGFSKPSPEIFRAALDKMGTDDAFTFTVGDTPYDILASHRCALPVVAVLSGGVERELLTKAEFIFEDVEELGRRIEEIDAYFTE